MAVGEIVTLINRTARDLSVRFDGRVRILKPGPNVITAEWIRFAKQQNPRMGSFLPGTLQGDYLVGVEGVDDVDMIDESEDGTPIEMFSREDETREGRLTNLGTGERPARRMNVGEFRGEQTAAEFNGRQ